MIPQEKGNFDDTYRNILSLISRFDMGISEGLLNDGIRQLKYLKPIANTERQQRRRL